MKHGFSTGRRRKEWHKEFAENVEKQAKTMGFMETAKRHNDLKKR
jgi:hypothetical protein